MNQKTRAAAYGLLVELGQAMQDAAPPAMPDLDAHMAGMELQGKLSMGSETFLKASVIVSSGVPLIGTIAVESHVISQYA